MYVLMQFSLKHEQTLTISRYIQSPKFLRQLLKTTDLNELTLLSFTIVHQSEQGQV